MANVALDIGGTLAKVCWVDSAAPVDPLDFEYEGATMHLSLFDTQDLDSLIAFISPKLQGEELPVTGGGAFKYCEKLEQSLGVRVKKVDEMQALHKGFKYVIKHVPQPAFTYRESQGVAPVTDLECPCLLVNCGTGVSILKIEEEKMRRVTGTCLGGGSLLGLASALLGVRSYEEIMRLCEVGNAANVDILMSDIYGPDGGDTVAVSLGKVALNEGGFEKADLARSLLNMFAYNVGNIAYLVTRLEKVSTIFFAGNFIRNHHYTMDRITFAVDYWSHQTVRPLFLKHDGFFGVIGAYLVS